MASGRPVDDVWDIDKLNNSAKEATGYETQKPESLLERVIEASTTDFSNKEFLGAITASSSS